MIKLFLAIIFTGAAYFQISAQNNSLASLKKTASINWENFELETNNVETDWTFHADYENKVLYIDFESLGGKMSRLYLKNADEEVIIMDDHLHDLPPNTIYELSLSKLEIGTYSVELYTYKTVIKEEIIIQ
jgi:hypothetical protein